MVGDQEIHLLFSGPTNVSMIDNRKKATAKNRIFSCFCYFLCRFGVPGTHLVIFGPSRSHGVSIIDCAQSTRALGELYVRACLYGSFEYGMYLFWAHKAVNGTKRQPVTIARYIKHKDKVWYLHISCNI